jgi:glycosyltransferase involved in cell wall biosynthesis
MKVSVILCTYSLDRFADFQEAAESILSQTYRDIELVIIVDGTDSVYDKVKNKYESHESTTIHCNEKNKGLSYSRNIGAELADGHIVAFIDDDAVAHPDWVEHLVDAYNRYDTLAAGGRMIPDWLSERPEYLPEEYYFLIGVTYRGFREQEGYVRNTFSSNLSFDRETFLSLGGYKNKMGKRGENDLQGGETELCVRLQVETGSQVMYVPDAKVEHNIYNYRTERRWLLERAFWQGYSKRRMEETNTGAIATEQEFLHKLLVRFTPEYIIKLVKKPSIKNADKFMMLVLLTILTGVGYLYAILSNKN